MASLRAKMQNKCWNFHICAKCNLSLIAKVFSMLEKAIASGLFYCIKFLQNEPSIVWMGLPMQQTSGPPKPPFVVQLKLNAWSNPEFSQALIDSFVVRGAELKISRARCIFHNLCQNLSQWVLKGGTYDPRAWGPRQFRGPAPPP